MKININFTVVVCTFNRPNLIKKSLIKILENICLPKKIVIIDQNSNELTSKISKKVFKNYKFRNFKIIKNSINPGLTVSKNISLKYIKTKYVFFLDDDILVEKNFFKNIINLISLKKAHGVCGVVSNYNNNWIKNFIYYILNHGAFKDNRYYFLNYKNYISKNIFYKRIDSLPGGITCFDTKVFKKLKFDENNITHNYEDVDFSIRLKEKFLNYRFYISFNSYSLDRLIKSQKEDITKRIRFMYLLYLKNKSMKFFLFFSLSFFGLILSNVNKLSFKVIVKIFRIFKKDNIK